jgi:predicted extracellular nuclease
MVRISGTVSEAYGMTCLQDITQSRLVSSNNPLPLPVIITTGQLSRADEAEAYEGVYTRLLNTTSSGNKSQKTKFQVTDGSGTCAIICNMFSARGANKSYAASSHYSSITGVVTFGFSEFALAPIAVTDMIIQQTKFIQNRSWGKIKSIYK